ncbi:MAG: glycosyltransferase family 39 protein [Deltaproteobacteria bacterium]|nr:glycosyltransferase family 39 protein [Deltaproteobacteria bacterium]MDZ4346749.1 glycosyltransferase family 39 protein [Candidatus Binatia bacterium]
MNEQRLYSLYLLLLSALLFFPFLGSRDFWAPVEPRYAEIARVMFMKGEWIVPTVNGDLYTDKPILFFWLVLIFSKLAGSVNEWTVRLPAVLGALGAVLTTYKLGKDFFGPKIGFMAAVVLATSVRVILEARWAHVDMLFTFLFLLSMLFAARAVLVKENRNEMIAAYVFMALAVLTKGLIGVVLPALVLMTFVVVRRDWRLLAKARLPLGIPLFLLVAAPWFYLVNQATGGKWLGDFIYIHHVRRFTEPLGHREPFYYYFTTLPVDLLPWTIFALPALFAYKPSKKLFAEPTSLFFTLWFFVIFIFFSLSDSKRDLYLLPLLPVTALFIAVYFEDLVSGKLSLGWLQSSLAFALFGLLALGCLALPMATWMLRRDAFGISIPIALAIGAGALIVFYFLWRREPWRLFLATALLMAVGLTVASAWVLPYLDQFKSPRPLALAVNAKVPPGVPLYIYADTMNDYNFYTGREIIPVLSSRPGSQAPALANQAGYLLIRDRDLQRIHPLPDDKVLLSQSVGGKTWYLVSLADVEFRR